MFAVLGNIIFETSYAPESLSHTDNTTYATHNLVSGKPRLQPVANELEEITLSVKLRAEFCNPANEALSFKTAKDGFAVMPFVLGTGQYIGEFVIISIGKTVNQTLDDGTVIESVLQISLKEFVSPDKLQQQQQAAKKKAFAINKTPVNTGRTLTSTPAQLANVHMSLALAESKSVGGQVSNFEHNTSQRSFISQDIAKSITNVKKGLADYQAKFNELNAQQNTLIGDYNAITTAVSQMQAAANGFTFPVTSLSDLQFNNNILQNAAGNLNTANSTLSMNVITRRI